MTGYLVLNLKVIKALSLVKSIGVGGSTALSVSNQTRLSGAHIVCTSRCLEVVVTVSIFTLLVRWLFVVAVGIVYEALLFEEVFPPSFSLLCVILSKGIVLDIDLALSSIVAIEMTVA